MQRPDLGRVFEQLMASREPSENVSYQICVWETQQPRPSDNAEPEEPLEGYSLRRMKKTMPRG